MIKIKDKIIKTNVFLAPMSGCTDFSFRLIARQMGAKFCFFEMIDSKGLLFNLPKSLSLLKTNRKDSPIAAQLLGTDSGIMLEAAWKIVNLVDITFLDINCACPAKKVVSKKAGAYLLKDTKNLYAIVKKLSSSLPVPVTVKIRLGYDSKDIDDLLKTVQGCRDNGASAVFVHGRTKSQGYAGDVDYDAIRSIKSSLDIPVFGSGNVYDAKSAKMMLDKTNCDGILVARGALGNPWIFKEIDYYLRKNKLIEKPGFTERKKMLLQHLAHINKYKVSKGSYKVGFMKKFAMWYLKGYPGACRIRENICGKKSYEDLSSWINKL